MNAFDRSNTQGYSQSDLDTLNAEFTRRGGNDLDEHEDGEAYKALTESILRNPPAGIEPGA